MTAAPHQVPGSIPAERKLIPVGSSLEALPTMAGLVVLVRLLARHAARDTLAAAVNRMEVEP